MFSSTTVVLPQFSPSSCFKTPWSKFVAALPSDRHWYGHGYGSSNWDLEEIYLLHLMTFTPCTSVATTHEELQSIDSALLVGCGGSPLPMLFLRFLAIPCVMRPPLLLWQQSNPNQIPHRRATFSRYVFNTWVVSAHSLALKPVWFVTKFSTASWQCRCWAIDSFGILLAISLPPSRSLLVTQHLSATASHTSFLPNADWIPLPRHPLFLRFSSSPPCDCLILIHSHWFFPHLLRILHSAESPSTHLGASLSHQPPRILLFFPAAPRLRGLRASLDPSWRLGNSCLVHSPEGTPLNVVND